MSEGVADRAREAGPVCLVFFTVVFFPGMSTSLLITRDDARIEIG